MRRAGLTGRNRPRMPEPVWAGMAKKSSYRLSTRLRSSAKARRNYITYLMSGGDPKAKAEREITMLYAQESASGYVGYSSFPDDQFGDLKGPQPIPENPLLALMKLPGGGDYGVFGGNAVSKLKTAEIVVGETTAKPALADTLTYTAGNNRTAVFFAEDQLTMEPEHEYPFTVRGVPAVRLTGSMGAGGTFVAGLGDIVELRGVAGAGGALAGRLCIEQRMKAAGELGGAMRGHIYPPLTLQGSPELGGSMTGNLQIIHTMRGAMALGGDMYGGMVPVVALAGRMALEGMMRGRVVPPIKLRGVMGAGGEMAGAIEEYIPPAAEPVQRIGVNSIAVNGNNSQTLNPPAGVVAGDILIAVFGSYVVALPTLGLNGWTYAGGLADRSRHCVYYKIATGDIAQDRVTASTTSGTTSCVGFMVAYRGADQVNPIGGSSYVSNSGSLTPFNGELPQTPPAKLFIAAYRDTDSGTSPAVIDSSGNLENIQQLGSRGADGSGSSEVRGAVIDADIILPGSVLPPSIRLSWGTSTTNRSTFVTINPATVG